MIYIVPSLSPYTDHGRPMIYIVPLPLPATQTMVGSWYTLFPPSPRYTDHGRLMVYIVPSPLPTSQNMVPILLFIEYVINLCNSTQLLLIRRRSLAWFNVLCDKQLTNEIDFSWISFMSHLVYVVCIMFDMDPMDQFLIVKWLNCGLTEMYQITRQ